MSQTPLARFPPQPLPAWRRAVLKVGSSLLAASDTGLSTRHVLALAEFVRVSRAAGRELVIVSSGAVAAGRALLRQRGAERDSLAGKQALAALGQAQVVALWQRFFDAPVAQVLLTHDDLRNRRRYLNARATLRELLRLDAIPVVNENDTVGVDELKLGDNDNLAAMVAALVDADLLLIASDVPGLYDADPRTRADAQPMLAVDAVTSSILAVAGGAGSAHGTGGMLTKLQAAQKAAEAGIATALFPGSDAEAVRALADGRLHGTRFAAARSRLAARKHWIRHAPATAGAIVVDAGAARALREGGASLLPGGVASVEGEFGRGDVVEIRTDAGAGLARGVAQYSAREMRRLAGRHTREIENVLGYSYGENLVHRDDLVLTAAEEAGA
jgi:glutamate 5-kinase